MVKKGLSPEQLLQKQKYRLGHYNPKVLLGKGILDGTRHGVHRVQPNCSHPLARQICVCPAKTSLCCGRVKFLVSQAASGTTFE